MRRRNFRPSAVKTKRKCGSRTSDLWQSSLVGSAEPEQALILLSVTDQLTATIVIPNEGQCEDHMWLKYKDIRNTPDKVIMLEQGLWVIMICAIRQKQRVATDTWRSLGCRTTPLEHWRKRKPTVELGWAKQQTKKLRLQPTKINSFM